MAYETRIFILPSLERPVRVVAERENCEWKKKNKNKKKKKKKKLTLERDVQNPSSEAIPPNFLY